MDSLEERLEQLLDYIGIAGFPCLSDTKGNIIKTVYSEIANILGKPGHYSILSDGLSEEVKNRLLLDKGLRQTYYGKSHEQLLSELTSKA